MAYAAITCLMRTIHQSMELTGCDLQPFYEKLECLRAILEKPWKATDDVEALTILEAEITELAYSAEDMIDLESRKPNILTTRNVELAEYASSVKPPYHMRLMNFDESWSLSYEKVSAKDSFPHEFEQLEKQIALKCRGLPLSVVVIGGLLSKIGKSLGDWQSVASNLRHLRLDWNYLRSHEPTEKSLVLKNLQCFSGLNPREHYTFGFYSTISSAVSEGKVVISCRCVPLLLLPPSDAFPQNPKSLALSGQFFLPWKDLSIVGKLPKLESLKLSYNACEGVEWEVADEDISYCQESVVNSARQIQQDIQDSYGCSVEVHTRPVPPADCLLSPIGLPLRPGQPLCMYYCRYGICKFGSSCKFDHPMQLSLPESRKMPSGDNNIDIYPPITSQHHYFACTNSFEDAFQLVDLLKKGDLNSSNMASNSFLGAGPLMFTGENYHMWIIKMKAYLKDHSLWEAVESENDPPPLGPNPTVAQMKNYEDAKS
ncbi:Zinc finger CCCH domain-containing protein 33 [Capsicum baccatum]|uniref:Zinc finger CCCH domain-containing protein 33 n=1 Tax=Capsicum baccatum TaxID=33114 RepID=A0A2G2X3E9_CAPBA|nr:Zinc finger CCCH domain-containing protein 33 [Capsicum baccatum]